MAKQAGVSIATVSRVLNGSSNVSAKTKEKVLAIMKREDYTPNIFARGLGLNSIKMIGLLCTDVSDIFYAKAVSVIENALKPLGFNSMLCCTGNNLEDKKKYMDLLLANRVDALILIGSTFKEKTDNSHIAKVAAQIPTVVINALIDLPTTYCVVCDQFQAMYDNVHILHKHGHDRILYLYDVDTYSSNQKLEGYKAAHHDLGLPLHTELILKVNHNKKDILDTLDSLFKKGITFSAVLATDDYMAICSMHSLIARGYSIPKDIPVIGFNNSMLCECSIPTLTSVDNMVESLCITAVNLLTDIFQGKNVTHKITLSAQLIERDSFQS
ncbi:LacI family DNA-binding transcriptional regulator [Sporanaerobium hydrogeniformans]|uniref:LacI family DNA-binding transcriptional regulator n=1 Tax=Sporanaerobium hydrogeniformans TaxID=3072179 RepID=UPI0027E4DC36|nr:LacI family DNA-binding transcriptional regulator [Sporanaerobium hydrogeniformans]